MRIRGPLLTLGALCLLALGCTKDPNAREGTGKQTPPGEATTQKSDPEESKEAPAAALLPPAVGEKARDGTVFSVDGASRALADTWSEKRAVVVFYRGHW